MAEKRRPDFRRIPTSRTFTIEGIAAALGRQPATVALWIRQGLPTIDDAHAPDGAWVSFAHVAGGMVGEEEEALYRQRILLSHVPSLPNADRCNEGLFTAPATTTLTTNCPTCERLLYKFTTPQRAVEMLFSAEVLTGKELRLSRRDISSDNPMDSSTGLAGASDCASVAPLESEMTSPRVGQQGAASNGSGQTSVAWNGANERAKALYLDFRAHADGIAPISIVKMAKAIRRYEQMTMWADFRTFNAEKAKDFKRFLAEQGIAPASMDWTLHALRHFFEWLRTQPGYRRKIALNDIAYLKRSRKERRAANSRAEKTYPSVEMAEKAIAAMPSATPVQKRDRALMIFLLLSAVRVGAAISLKLKHYDPARHLITQNPLEMNTKNSKRIVTVLIPHSEKLEALFDEYVKFCAKNWDLGTKIHCSQSPPTELRSRSSTGSQKSIGAPLRMRAKS